MTPNKILYIEQNTDGTVGGSHFSLLFLVENLDRQIYSPVGALRVLALFGLLRAISSLAEYLYNAIGRPYLTFYITLGKLACIAMLIYPLTAKHGIEGAARAITAPSIAEFGVGLLILTTTIKINIYTVLRELFPIIVSSGAMALFLLILKMLTGKPDLILLATLFVAGSAFYMIAIKKQIGDVYRWGVGS